MVMVMVMVRVMVMVINKDGSDEEDGHLFLRPLPIGDLVSQPSRHNRRVPNIPRQPPGFAHITTI